MVEFIRRINGIKKDLFEFGSNSTIFVKVELFDNSFGALYFLAAEAKEGDPLLIDDPAGVTTDSEEELADGWDEDGDFDPDEDMEDFEMVQKDHNM
jgi:hypothetical protein